MELEGKTIVVTGAASGIGRAMAQRFAREGAMGIVVADIDEAGVGETAAGIGDAAVAVGCDVASDADVDRLLATARDAFGPVDLFCANAGIAIPGTGLDNTDEEWDRIWGINVRSHVIAARKLVPEWIERGDGYFLSTASAAGLLTQIGSVSYAVTKHAAVSFAEWLAVTYGGQGLKVSCLCPMGVNTALLNEGLAAGEDGLGAKVVEAAGEVLEPDDVASAVVDAINAESFLVLPHPEVLTFFQRKGADYERWIAGMQRLQTSLTGE